jgi:hypothetical protein
MRQKRSAFGTFLKALTSGSALSLLFILSLNASSTAQTQRNAQSRQLEQVESVKQWPGKAKRWALVIGVDNYKDGQISPLKGSANDARMLADALVRYAGFPQDQVILMSTDQPEERQPTRVNILRRLSNLASVVPKDGLLLISFAGHGMERNGQAYLLPSDAQISDDITFLEETAVSVARMKERIRATGVGQVVVLLDACRNDPGGRADAPNPLTAAYTKFNFDVRNREVQAFATFYATAVGQRAYEYTEKHQGYFTWAVVEGIKGGAANERGEVTLGNLVKYVQENVPKRIGIDLGGGKQQRPFAIIEGYKADELVIAVAGQVSPVAETQAVIPLAKEATAVELAYWDSIKSSADPEDFKAYLEKYPNGQFSDLARRRLRSKNESTAQANMVNDYNKVLKELLDLEQLSIEAALKGDKAFLGGMMAEEFSLAQDGKTYNKAEYLSKVKAQKNVKSFNIENANLSLTGDAVVLTGISIYKVKQLLIETTVKQQFSDRFIKRDGKWLIVGSQVATVK